MKTFKHIVWMSLFLVGLQSCTDIFEEEIDDESIRLLAPADQLRTEEVAHTFWWEEVEGANRYRLQLVSPTFTAIQKLVLDTLVAGDKFEYTMVPGSYQWRVRGENSNSVTEYSTATIFIDSTLDLSSQKVNLLFPVDGTVTNDDSWTFEWQDMYNADLYQFEIRRNALNGSLVYSAADYTSSNLSYTLDEEGLFYWKVQAYNQTSGTSTPFSSNELLIDTTDPAIALLSNPNDDDLLDQSSDDIYLLEWTAEVADQDEAAVSCLLYVSSVNSSSFSGVNPIELEANASQLSYQIELDNLGTYYWKVKTIDEAGNESAFSETYRFTIQ